jgi:hypothetical protein
MDADRGRGREPRGVHVGVPRARRGLRRSEKAKAPLAVGVALCLAGLVLFLLFVPGATGDVAVSVAGGIGLLASIVFSAGGLLIAFALGTRLPRSATAPAVSKAARREERPHGDDSPERPLSGGEAQVPGETRVSPRYMLVSPGPSTTASEGPLSDAACGRG